MRGFCRDEDCSCNTRLTPLRGGGIARSGIAVMIFSYCDAARYGARGRACAPMQLFLK
jgi:hypothetical protein